MVAYAMRLLALSLSVFMFLGAKVKKVEDSVRKCYILNQSKPIQ